MVYNAYLLAFGSTFLVYDVLALPHQKSKMTKANPTEPPAPERRERARPLRVFVSPSEREQIEANAALANMSVSSYLRATGLNTPLRSTLDYDSALKMLSVAGDLGKFAGVVKLWLSQRRGEGVTVADLNLAMREARDVQRQILDLVKQAKL